MLQTLPKKKLTDDFSFTQIVRTVPSSTSQDRKLQKDPFQGKSAFLAPT